MADLIIHGTPRSSYVWTARLACAEKGIEYDLGEIEFGSKEHVALHPFTKIPVMTQSGFVLYETAAIVRYIDETNDGPPLQPTDPKQRAVMEQFISAYVDYYYDYLVRRLVINRLIAPQRGGETDEQLIADSMAGIEQRLAVADKMLSSNDHLAGPDVSLADLFLLPAIFWADKTPEGANLLPKFASLQNWRQRMEARPSFAATLPPMPQADAAE